MSEGWGVNGGKSNAGRAEGEKRRADNPMLVQAWGAAVCRAVCNMLAYSRLLTALQKVAFWLVKDGVLHAERPPFARRFAAFWKWGGKRLYGGLCRSRGKAVSDSSLSTLRSSLMTSVIKLTASRKNIS